MPAPDAPNHFDELMAEVCPGAREEVHRRIEQVAVAWKIIANHERNRGLTLREILQSGDGRVSEGEPSR